MKMKVQVVEAQGFQGNDNFRIQDGQRRHDGREIRGIDLCWEYWSGTETKKNWMFLPDHIVEILAALHEKKDSSEDST
jgi:hypothetical protein